MRTAGNERTCERRGSEDASQRRWGERHARVPRKALPTTASARLARSSATLVFTPPIVSLFLKSETNRDSIEKIHFHIFSVNHGFPNSCPKQCTAAARRIGSDPARINAVRTDPTPHRTDAPVGLVRTRSNRCGPNQSDASSNRCVRRIASGPARIGADRTDSARLGPVRRAGLMRARLGLVRRSY